MKNIQIIDGADNCTYSIFSIEDDAFQIIFPNEQDVEFIEDLHARVGEEKLLELLTPVWKRPVNKKNVHGIHGTLFYQLKIKKRYYPTKKEQEMVSNYIR
ncbi:hypothetical protein O4H49_19160 [Kiloniella laminariae]|uniref:Uncharacterized protein n=1 Tax=Kiloniella laminariae TaxID=454162 RepID=A0ABT4LP65_9PROT|nr:hypothetical protein [Kiloniella laminariae]MCZ4282913.1 hypothetical protein [Kiloniella laminariae]